MAERYFTRQTFGFLKALAENNDRAWFEARKGDYEELVREPALKFIADLADDLSSISRHFQAEPKKAGGSLMRVYRDTRFSRDKTPYKTNIGIQFRHMTGRDVHAPGFYLHIEPGECFVGVGMWRPEADALFKVRERIVQKPEAWISSRDDKNFNKYFALWGESLSTSPRGFAKDHPLIEDIKRRDFVGLAALSEKTVASSELRKAVVERFKASAPYMRFLCDALGVGF